MYNLCILYVNLCIIYAFFVGIVLVTDAISALGLPPGLHKLGTMDVSISEKDAKIFGTETLAGRYLFY